MRLVKPCSWSLLLMAFLLLPESAFAQIYKWVDQNSKIQYEDQAPADKHNSELFKVNPLNENKQSIFDWQEGEREFRKRRIEKQMQAEKEKPPVPQGEICHSARYKLQMLDGKVIYRVNEKGERVYMEDTERIAIETKAQLDIEKYCPR